MRTKRTDPSSNPKLGEAGATRRPEPGANVPAKAGTVVPATSDASNRHVLQGDLFDLPSTAMTAYEAVMRTGDPDGNGIIDWRDPVLAARNGSVYEVVLNIGGEPYALNSPDKMAMAADLLAHAARVDPHGPIPDEIKRPYGELLAKAIADATPAFVRDFSTVKSLAAMLVGSNLPAPDRKRHIWVPASDPQAVQRLRNEAEQFNSGRQPGAPEDERHWPVQINVLDSGTPPHALDELHPGILYLPHEGVVPGGRFNEVYGWDSYFAAQGLNALGKTDLSEKVIRNLAYMIEHYGKIPNSSRSYHLSRAHPPFLAKQGLELYKAVKTDEERSRIRTELFPIIAKAAEKELANVWYAKPRRLEVGLSRYHDEQRKPDIEVERNLASKGHFTFPNPKADRAARESGWDLTHRFKDRAHQMLPVDLNSLLYAYERDLAEIYRLMEGSASANASRHDVKAGEMIDRLRHYLWNPEKRMFSDYDFHTGEHSDYESAAMFSALFARWASPQEAAQMLETHFDALMQKGGLSTSTPASREKARREYPLGAGSTQWDEYTSWAPLQELAAVGCENYGFHDEKNEIAYRFCYTLRTIAAENNGLIPEKVDAHALTHEVKAAEYGNQGEGRGSYDVPRENNAQGFAWTNASFITLRGMLPEHLRKALDEGVPPSNFFPKRGIEKTDPDA